MPVIATAAWSIPKKVAHKFAPEGNGIARYASVFDGVEINSTFYRRHKPTTFAGWADSVPDSFRFSVKMPREITHIRAMKDINEPLHIFLEDIAALGEKCGPLLCQLPPSLRFNQDVMKTAFQTMREACSLLIVLEARHKSWMASEALALLQTYSIERVFADPAPVWPYDSFEQPPFYMRLHGQPKIYYSSYCIEEINRFSQLLTPYGWCVFDNIASGAAIENALALSAIIKQHERISFIQSGQVNEPIPTTAQ